LDDWLDPILASYASTQKTLPLDPVNIEGNVQEQENIFGPLCKAENVDYLAHISALDVARDLDLIRNLTGYNTTNFFGWDYGSIIGFAYASLFPHRVDRFLFDGLPPLHIML
jgi:pimeloyl-ACP methyl ester carboxylesterase